MKRMIVTMAAVLVTVGMAWAQSIGIYTAQDLHDIRNNLSADYVLMADIDLGVAPWNEGEGWVPIGDDLNPFTGSLTNPDGYVIRGLTANYNMYSNDMVGLFSLVGTDGRVSGLLLENVRVGGGRVGVVIGGNQGIVENCVVTGITFGNMSNGGVVSGNVGIVRNNTALLQHVGSYAGSNVGRVVAFNTGTLVDNRAWSGMIVTNQSFLKNPLDNEADGLDGADMSTEEAYELLNDKGMRIPKYMQEGSEEYPYLIYTAEDLDDIRNGLDKHYVLMADIDLEDFIEDKWGDEGWVPIGEMLTGFTGSLDGNGFVIRGLRIDRSNRDNVGLFGVVGIGSRVKGILLENVNIVGQDAVGAVVGWLYGTVENCVVTGTVSGYNGVGGVVGISNGTTTNNVALLESVSGVEIVGRVVGGIVSGRVGGVSHTDNRAWSGMTVNGPYRDDSDDGADMTTEEAIELLEYLNMTVPQYLKDIADAVAKFLEDHEDILAEDETSDKEAVTQALNDYNALSPIAKTSLADEKKDLDNKLVHIRRLEAAQAYRDEYPYILGKTDETVEISDMDDVEAALDGYYAIPSSPVRTILNPEKELLDGFIVQIDKLIKDEAEAEAEAERKAKEKAEEEAEEQAEAERKAKEKAEKDAEEEAKALIKAKEDADIDIAAAVITIEDAIYTATQKDAGNKAKAKEAVEAIIAKLDLKGVKAEVIDGDFNAAKAGDDTKVRGTNGSYGFTVKLSKGTGDERTVSETLIIVATVFEYEDVSIRSANNKGKQKVLAKTVVSDEMVVVLAGVVKVVVYDALGNVVHSGDKPTWDLRNAAGRYVANGAYLVVVETRTGVHSVKVGVKR